MTNRARLQTWNSYITPPFIQNVLRFPAAGDAGENPAKFMAIQIANPELDGLPLWGPSNAGCTYLSERLTRQNTGYFGADPWRCNNGAFLWNSGASNSYYGPCPYPKSGTEFGTTHKHELSGVSNGTDSTVNRAGNEVDVIHGVMYTRGLRINYNGGNKFGLLYLNLPSVANADVIQGPIAGNEGNSAGAGNINPPNPVIRWGDSPWTDSAKECFAGDLGRIKVFSTLLSEADTVSEASDMSRLVTSAGIASIWIGKTNWLTIDDLTCDFGTGRVLSWADSTYKATLAVRGS